MATTTPAHDQRIAEMKFFSVYPHYVTKVEKKGRSIAELHEVIEWLTGYNAQDLNEMIENRVTFKEFFEKATINPNAELIKGVICGYRIEEIETKLTRQCRYLDKVIDELAKGRAIEKIKRQPKA